MKLVTFEVSTVLGRIRRIGAINDKSVVDLNMGYVCYLSDQTETQRAYNLAKVVIPPDMLSFLRNGREGREAAEKAISYILKRTSWPAPIKDTTS